jgi:hypothetical protein
MSFIILRMQEGCITPFEALQIWRKVEAFLRNATYHKSPLNVSSGQVNFRCPRGHRWLLLSSPFPKNPSRITLLGEQSSWIVQDFLLEGTERGYSATHGSLLSVDPGKDALYLQVQIKVEEITDLLVISDRPQRKK